MTKTDGQSIFDKLLQKLYSKKAPTFYIMGQYRDFSLGNAALVYKTIDALMRNYRKSYYCAGKAELQFIYSSKLFDQSVYAYEAAGRDISKQEMEMQVRAFRQRTGFVNDRDMLAFAPGSQYYDASVSYRSIFNGYDDVEAMRKQLSELGWSVDLVPVISLSTYDCEDDRLVTTNSIVFALLGEYLTITMFGSKADEVHSFVEKPSGLEYIPNSLLCSYEEIEYARQRRHRTFGGDCSTAIMSNLFGAFVPQYCESAHDTLVQFKEKYSLVNAATIPLGEAIRLAIPIEHSIDIAAASPHKRTTAELAEEAIAVWTAGEYITCQDVTQPGLSRTGSIVYISKLLGEVIVLSFNLKLSKGKK